MKKDSKNGKEKKKNILEEINMKTIPLIRKIILLLFVLLGGYFLIHQSQDNNYTDKSNANINESNSKLMRKLDPEFDEMMTDLEELENQIIEEIGINEIKREIDEMIYQINEESGINQLNREMDELINQINEESGINQLNRELDAMNKELEELFIID